jgi:hypothetical protein
VSLPVPHPKHTSSVAPSEEQKQMVYDLYILRLSEPHFKIEDTFSGFSTFVTGAYGNTAYEAKMVEANAIFAPSKANFERREPKETELRKAGYSAEAYLSYVAYERTGKKAESDESFDLAKNLFERAVADHPTDWTVWEGYLQLCKDRLSAATLQQGEDDVEEDEADDALSTALLGYRITAEKACRYMPDCAEAWINLMRLEEREGDNAACEAVFARAIETGLLGKNLESVVKLYIARADCHRRAFEQAGASDPVLWQALSRFQSRKKSRASRTP